MCSGNHYKGYPEIKGRELCPWSQLDKDVLCTARVLMYSLDHGKWDSTNACVVSSMVGLHLCVGPRVHGRTMRC